tara:strand:+ start:3953 stop:4057 length:105 start_codon:yes stop_codon:yes gene_type:complete
MVIEDLKVHSDIDRRTIREMLKNEERRPKDLKSL